MRRLILIMVLVLVGCENEPAKPRRTSKERQEAAEVKLQTTPVPRVYRYGDGELRVLEVPVRAGRSFVDQQRCFLWRDEAFKTAAISCDPHPELPAVDQGPNY